MERKKQEEISQELVLLTQGLKANAEHSLKLLRQDHQQLDSLDTVVSANVSKTERFILLHHLLFFSVESDPCIVFEEGKRGRCPFHVISGIAFCLCAGMLPFVMPVCDSRSEGTLYTQPFRENTKLQQEVDKGTTFTLTLWMLITIVCLVFVFMVLFMKVFSPKRRIPTEWVTIKTNKTGLVVQNSSPHPPRLNSGSGMMNVYMLHDGCSMICRSNLFNIVNECARAFCSASTLPALCSRSRIKSFSKYSEKEFRDFNIVSDYLQHFGWLASSPLHRRTISMWSRALLTLPAPTTKL